MSKLQAWLQNEPVRLYIYGLVAPVLALLVGLGIISGDVATSIGAIAGAALLVPVGALLRRRVTPVWPEVDQDV